MNSIINLKLNAILLNPFVDRFNEGGPFFMTLLLICLVLVIFFIVKSAIALKKTDYRFVKYSYLIGEAGLLALVLGILGSVIGMIEAFDAIEGFGSDMSTAMIAGGLKVSFLTMVFGSFTFIVSRIAIVILKWMKVE